MKQNNSDNNNRCIGLRDVCKWKVGVVSSTQNSCLNDNTTKYEHDLLKQGVAEPASIIKRDAGL